VQGQLQSVPPQLHIHQHQMEDQYHHEEEHHHEEQPRHLPPDAILLTSTRSSLSSPWSTLPPGWETATSPVDGRIYYWELHTGRTSWAHPLAQTLATCAVGTPTSYYPPLPPPPPPLQIGVSKDMLLPQTMPTSTHLRNPFHGWGQFFSGGYQSAIPSSASVSSHGSGSNRQITRSEWLDTPLNASRRPSSHQCHAMAAFILFPPLGVCAFIHSFQVDSAWRQGRYGEAFDHSTQARSYASVACWIGVCLWLYWLLVIEDGWPDSWKLKSH
jgi:hypothetical protein